MPYASLSKTRRFGLDTEIAVFLKRSSSSRHADRFLMLAVGMVMLHERFRSPGWKWS